VAMVDGDVWTECWTWHAGTAVAEPEYVPLCWVAVG
jgi:hypothetical protein